jgi:hypothetical protein
VIGLCRGVVMIVFVRGWILCEGVVTAGRLEVLFVGSGDGGVIEV